MIESPPKTSKSLQNETADEIPNIPGLRISNRGFRPITTLREFMAGLPKFDDDEVAALRKAIAESRAERRALARERKD